MKNEEIADKNVHKLGVKPSRAGDVNILGKLPDRPRAMDGQVGA